MLDVAGATPKEALKRLQTELAGEQGRCTEWRKRARIAAVLGSCPRSHGSFRAGVRHWVEFIATVHVGEAVDISAFPPKLEDVLAWSSTFRCPGTFCNYLGYLRTACHAVGVEAPPVGHSAIKRAIIAIAKRGQFRARAKMFIRRAEVLNMVLAAERGLESKAFAMLVLFTYTFLLRMPSEVCKARTRSDCVLACVRHAALQALPACRSDPCAETAAAEQTLVWKDGDDLCVRMLRRKNMEHGSGLLRRRCTCTSCFHMCPIHMLWDQFLALIPVGERPWAAVSSDNARNRLRCLLGKLSVPNAQLYGTHDLRRGHAEVSQLVLHCSYPRPS